MRGGLLDVARGRVPGRSVIAFVERGVVGRSWRCRWQTPATGQRPEPPWSRAAFPPAPNRRMLGLPERDPGQTHTQEPQYAL
jgi:hypothetical protein